MEARFPFLLQWGHKEELTDEYIGSKRTEEGLYDPIRRK